MNSATRSRGLVRVLSRLSDNRANEFRFLCSDLLGGDLRKSRSLGNSPIHSPHRIRKETYFTSSCNWRSPKISRLIHPIEEFSKGPANAKKDEEEDHRIDPEAIRVEDILFEMFKGPEDTLPIGKFLAALKATGLRVKSDPRLKETLQNLRNVYESRKGEAASPESLSLDRETFKNVITPNIVIISRAFRGQFVIPDFNSFSKYVEEFYWKCKANHGGKCYSTNEFHNFSKPDTDSYALELPTVASYIPQLSRFSPDYWGVSVCTVDGQRFSMGEVDVPITIQSCSKPLTYAICLNELGAETVHKYVGQEPSGRMFNELILDHNKKPHNPMINAGAIVVCSLALSLIEPQMKLSDKFDYVSNYFKRMAGYEFLGFSNATFLSEREAADRNYALGFYMRENKCFPDHNNLKETMDFYFQICSLEATCDSLSVMASTLANGGICPTTGEQIFQPHSVRDVLSLMHSCGMYDYSGQFAFNIGLPAKSGVSGALLLVVPNVMGMCLWSPPLDALGNSVRGVQFCEELIRVFNFHRYDNLKHTAQKRDPRRHKYEAKGLEVVSLLFSAASGDVTAMRRHKLSGMDMSQCDYDGRTALHLSAAEGHLECVDFLLTHCRVPPNPKDRWGQSPLDDARTFKHDNVYAFLMKYMEQNEDKMLTDEMNKVKLERTIKEGEINTHILNGKETIAEEPKKG